MYTKRCIVVVQRAKWSNSGGDRDRSERDSQKRFEDHADESGLEIEQSLD